MATITVRTTHANSSTVDDQVIERRGKREIDDAVAVTIASWYQSPGTIGRHLAALASGATVEYRELADDIHATWMEVDRHGEADALTMKLQLDMLSTWALDRTKAGTADYAYAGPGYVLPDTPDPEARYSHQEPGVRTHTESAATLSVDRDGWTSHYVADRDEFHVRTPEGQHRTYRRVR